MIIVNFLFHLHLDLERKKMIRVARLSRKVHRNQGTWKKKRWRK
jgi:hypothetical protein